MVTVRLDWPLLRRAAHLGVDRRVNRLEEYDGRELFYANDPWDRDIRGAIAEAGVALLAGVADTWPNGSRPDGTGPDAHVGDVNGWEVRSVVSPAHRLGVQRRDRPDRVHVLVVVQPRRLPCVDVVGWCYGHEAMDARRGYWDANAPHPAYLVPAQDLHAWPAP